MLNKVIIQGRMTKDVEMKQTQGGIAYCTFTLAWSEKYKDTETKLFLPCKAWRGTADFIGKYMGAKGNEIILEGRLVTEQWQDKDGNNQSRTAMDVERAHFAGSKKADSADKPATGFADPDAELPF